MSSIKSILEDARLALQRVLPGLTVLFVVLVLLRGFSGTAEAIKLQIATLVTSFLGAGDGIGAVLIHTLPLAIAAAIATFAIASRALTFQSASSFFALACIILIGASVGGSLRGIVSEWSPKGSDAVARVAETTTSESIRPKSLGINSIGNTDRIGVGSNEPSPATLSRLNVAITNASKIATKPVPLPTRKSPLEQLSAIDWFAQPDLAKSPPRRVQPLHVLPAIGGVLGFVFKAINQMLGYLVAYQPRLFLAAIIAGSWIGWTWHRRLTQLHDRVVEQSSDDNQEIEFRQAA